MVFAAIRGIIELADKTICERVNNIREFFRNLGEWMEGTFGFKWKNVFETVKNVVKVFRDFMGPIINSLEVVSWVLLALLVVYSQTTGEEHGLVLDRYLRVLFPD